MNQQAIIKSAEALEIEWALEALLTQDYNQFPAPNRRVKVNGRGGVYVIFDERKTVLHVGRSINLNRRLNAHRYFSSSFSKRYLKVNELKINEQYSFKYLQVNNSRKRALLESLAIGILCPKHLGTGRAQEE